MMGRFASMNPLREIRTRVQALRLWVTLDPADSSCTLSRGLFRHMRRRYDEPSVFVFRVPERGTYGFSLDHGITRPTQLCRIQCNDRERCIGFETLNPTANRILYDYGLPSDRPVRLSVSVWRCRMEDGRRMLYYQINGPHGRRAEKNEKA